jgi:DNA-binding NarL/FixJ family response regulator
MRVTRRKENGTLTEKNSIRILVVDDNESVRRGIVRILASEPAWQVCGEATNGEDAIQKNAELQPDVVLLDISMPGIGGLETARRLRAESARLAILILSQHDHSAILPRALKAGANGCLDKSCLAGDLLTSIRRLADRKAEDTSRQG